MSTQTLRRTKRRQRNIEQTAKETKLARRISVSWSSPTRDRRMPRRVRRRGTRILRIKTPVHLRTYKTLKGGQQVLVVPQQSNGTLKTVSASGKNPPNIEMVMVDAWDEDQFQADAGHFLLASDLAAELEE